MARITDLPVELVLQILDCWPVDAVRELSLLSRCSRSMHWLTFDHLFSNALSRRSKRGSPRRAFMRLVFHAIKHDSHNIAQWLCDHELRTELNGYVLSIVTIPGGGF